MQDFKNNAPHLPDMSELRVDTEEGKCALIDHTFGRMFSGVNFPQPLLLMPLEVNGVFLNNGIYVLSAFTFAEGVTNFNAISNIDRTYQELKQRVSKEFSRHCINYVFEVSGVVLAISCYFIREDGLRLESGPENMCRFSCESINNTWYDDHGENIVTACSNPFTSISNMFPEYQRLMKKIEFIQYQKSGIRKVLPDIAALDHIDIYMHPLDEALDAIDEKEANQIVNKVLHLITSIEPNTISDYDFRVHYFLFRLEGMLESKQMLTDAIRRKLRDICFSDSLSALNTELAIIISEAMRIASESRASTMGKILLRIERYVSDNLSSQDFSISALAEHLNTTPSSLSAKYKKATGKKLIDYISEQRIQLAEQLLMQSTLTISDVAEKSGYGSVSTMYRAFKKYRGSSPNAIRHGY